MNVVNIKHVALIACFISYEKMGIERKYPNNRCLPYFQGETQRLVANEMSH